MPALQATDEHGNVGIGEVLAIDTTDTIAITDDGLIATLGVDDLIVVKSGNAVLVTRREHGERIKELVARLEGEMENYK
jgi:mannose-1-phosphate guanylyltransferase